MQNEIKTKQEIEQQNIDIITTLILESGYCHRSATALFGTYKILKENHKIIPKELYELIQSSIDYNKKNLYGLLRLIQVSPSFRIGLALRS